MTHPAMPPEPQLAEVIPLYNADGSAPETEPPPEPDPSPEEAEVTVRWTRGTPDNPRRGMRMTGGIIRDPEEISAIRKRIGASSEGVAWRRAARRLGRWSR